MVELHSHTVVGFDRNNTIFYLHILDFTQGVEGGGVVTIIIIHLMNKFRLQYKLDPKLNNNYERSLNPVLHYAYCTDPVNIKIA